MFKRNKKSHCVRYRTQQVSKIGLVLSNLSKLLCMQNCSVCMNVFWSIPVGNIYEGFIFVTNQACLKWCSNFFCTLKILIKELCFPDIEFFIYFCTFIFSFFFSLAHCLRRWLEINLKVCDVINSVNKNLIIHFVWYLEKEKKNIIESLSIDRVLNKKYFYEKLCRKCSP